MGPSMWHAGSRRPQPHRLVVERHAPARLAPDEAHGARCERHLLYALEVLEEGAEAGQREVARAQVGRERFGRERLRALEPAPVVEGPAEGWGVRALLQRR